MGRCCSIYVKEKAKELGITPLGTLKAMHHAEFLPKLWVWPVCASRNAVKRAGITLDKLDWLKLNEGICIHRAWQLQRSLP